MSKFDDVEEVSQNAQPSSSAGYVETAPVLDEPTSSSSEGEESETESEAEDEEKEDIKKSEDDRDKPSGSGGGSGSAGAPSSTSTVKVSVSINMNKDDLLSIDPDFLDNIEKADYDALNALTPNLKKEVVLAVQKYNLVASKQKKMEKEIAKQQRKAQREAEAMAKKDDKKDIMLTINVIDSTGTTVIYINANATVAMLRDEIVRELYRNLPKKVVKKMRIYLNNISGDDLTLRPRKTLAGLKVESGTSVYPVLGGEGGGKRVICIYLAPFHWLSLLYTLHFKLNIYQ